MELREGADLGRGRYRLERCVGTGGMASVWRAADRQLERPVAIKVISDTLASDPGYVRRFAREARVAAGLRHANLVQIFDFAAEGERPYLVMEFVEGGTLDHRLRRDAGDQVDAEALARDLLGALDHIHGAGILHRDVKPANVLLGSDGRTRLTDFGIALPDNATDLTHTGQVIGTARYLAPEVMAGDRATARSDLYAAGVLLREVGAAERSVPLRRLVSRLTDADPRHRPGSAAEALALLDEDDVTGATAALPGRRARRTETLPLLAGDERAPERVTEPAADRLRVAVAGLGRRVARGIPPDARRRAVDAGRAHPARTLATAIVLAAVLSALLDGMLGPPRWDRDVAPLAPRNAPVDVQIDALKNAVREAGTR